MVKFKEIIESVRDQSKAIDKKIFIFPFSVYKDREDETSNTLELIYNVDLYQYDVPVFFDEEFGTNVINMIKEYINKNNFEDSKDKSKGTDDVEQSESPEEVNQKSNINIFYKGSFSVNVLEENAQSICVEISKVEFINGKLVETSYVKDVSTLDIWFE